MTAYPDLQLYIGGAWRKTSDSLPVLNPADESVIGAVPVAARADLDDALAAAKDGFRVWSRMSPRTRGEIMLKAAALMNARDPEWSAAELRRYADRQWLAAAEVLLPEQMPIDDQSLAPIFEAMDAADVPFVHHSFFYEPPYFPGYRDIWGNLAIARMASHPWGAQRLLAYVTLSGMFDRYPALRIGFAECSGAWLGGWLRAGLDVWGTLAQVGDAIGKAAATPEIATAMMGSALISALALYTLHHLLVYERRV